MNSTDRMLGACLQAAQALQPARRFAWQRSLRALWRRRGTQLADADLHRLLGAAAAGDDWPMVQVIARALHRRGSLDRVALHTWALAEWRMGDSAKALALSCRGMLLWPDQSALYELHEAVHDWVEQQGRDTAWTPTAEAGSLRLEPLGPHHATDFAWQYFDPAIAELCCLPHFEGVSDWRAWLDEIASGPHERLFAVIHDGWGFIGSVGLLLHQGVGLVSYWIGADFRGYGLATDAVRQLLQLGRSALSMRSCYAKVFAANAPSRRCLDRLGFEDLHLCAAPPHGDERFYRWGDPLPRHGAASELIDFCTALSTDVRPAALWLDPTTRLGRARAPASTLHLPGAFPCPESRPL